MASDRDFYLPDPNYPVGHRLNPYPFGRGPDDQPPAQIQADAPNHESETQEPQHLHVLTLPPSDAYLLSAPTPTQQDHIRTSESSTLYVDTLTLRTAVRESRQPMSSERYLPLVPTWETPPPISGTRRPPSLPSIDGPTPRPAANLRSRHVHFDVDPVVREGGEEEIWDRQGSRPVSGLTRGHPQSQIAPIISALEHPSPVVLRPTQCRTHTQPSPYRQPLTSEASWPRTLLPVQQHIRHVLAPTVQQYRAEQSIENSTHAAPSQVLSSSAARQSTVDRMLHANALGSQQADGPRTTNIAHAVDAEFERSEETQLWEVCSICQARPFQVKENKIKFCHGCYGEAVAAEKHLYLRSGPHKF